MILLVVCFGLLLTYFECPQEDGVMSQRTKFVHTSRYCSLERSTPLIRSALRNSVVATAELELDDVADRSSNNIRDIGVLWSSNYYRYNLVGPLDFRVDIAADL